ncbi:MAG: phosphoribosyltransferase [Acidobacteria bacterium]|nr:phosphoribosyltransferase [Acidobacteriota bacterium]
MSLIPDDTQVMDVFRKTGAFREGVFEHPAGYFTSFYFQIPLALRYADNARRLGVSLSRVLRRSRELVSALPSVSIVAPGPGGVPVAFEVRQALRAEQTFWSEREGGEYRFRQYNEIKPGQKCVIVDDIARSGDAVRKVHDLIASAGGDVLAVAVLVRLSTAKLDLPDTLPVYSLVEFEATKYEKPEACPTWHEGVTVERVRF